MKISIVKSILGIGFFINALLPNVQAQVTLRDVSGKTIFQKGTSEFSGSAFLAEQWSKGVIKFADNTSSKPLELKYDQLEDVVLFKNEKEEVLAVDEPIKEFKIFLVKDGAATEMLFRSGFDPANNNSNKAFYEVIADHKVKFIKRTLKTIVEEKEYNASTSTKKIVDKVFYFIVKANTPVLVSRNEKSILAAIEDKNAELSAYIKSNKLNLKNDADVVKLLSYYDELSK